MALSSRVMKWFTPSNTKRPCRAKIAPRAQLALEDLEDRLVMNGAVFTPNVSSLAEITRSSLVGFYKTGNFDVGAMHPQLIAVGQFNPAYDNYPDLFITNDDGSYTVLFGDGAGNFSPTVGPIVDGQQVVFSQGGPHSIDGVQSLEGVVAGDFNGDGITDVAVASSYPSGTVKILLGNGLGQFSVDSSLDLSGRGPSYLTAAYMDQDSALDLIVTDNYNNQVLIYRNLNNGTGRFDPMVFDFNADQNNLYNPEQAVVADFNGDGLLDIAVASKGNGYVSLFRGIGGGKITAAGNFYSGATGAIGLTAADFNHDYLPDLAVANYGTDEQGAHHIGIFRNVGDLKFEGDISLFNLGDHLINVVAADFNVDGRIDLAFTSAGDTAHNTTFDNQIFVLYNQGDAGGVINLAEAIYSLPAGTNPGGLIAADLDANGSPDLVSANVASNDVSVFINLRYNFPSSIYPLETPAIGPVYGDYGGQPFAGSPVDGAAIDNYFQMVSPTVDNLMVPADDSNLAAEVVLTDAMQPADNAPASGTMVVESTPQMDQDFTDPVTSPDMTTTNPYLTADPATVNQPQTVYAAPSTTPSILGVTPTTTTLAMSTIGSSLVTRLAAFRR